MNQKADVIRFPDRYRIIRELGRGSHGVVYLVEDKCTKKQLKLKALRQSRLNQDQIELMRYEFRNLSKLKHPNIGKVYDFNDCLDNAGNRQVFFTGEFVDGSPLNKTFNHEEMCACDWVEIIIQTSRALQYIHNTGLIHYDVKPSNIIINLLNDDSWHVKLIDFGLARELNKSSEMSIRGSFLYVAPEVIRGLLPDHRADLYSLGVSFYEMLSGSNPFFSRDPLDILKKHLEVLPDSLHSLRPDLPGFLCDVVTRLISIDREQRLTSAEEIIRYLSTKANDVYNIRSGASFLSSGQSGKLVGRNQELLIIKSIIKSCLPSVCLLTGVQGIGKTRLVTEAKSLAQIHGYKVLYHDCRNEESSFYTNLEHITNLKNKNLIDSEKLSDLEKQGLNYSSSSRIISSELSQKIITASQNNPLVMCFENVSFASSSINLLITQMIRFLRTSLRAGKRTLSAQLPELIIIITNNNSDVSCIPGQLQTNKKNSDLPIKRMELKNLSLDETATMIESIIGSISSRDLFVEKIHSLSNGNPLFIEELIQHLISQNILKMRNQIWVYNPLHLDRLTNAEGVNQILEKKICKLPEKERKLLELLSVIKKSVHLNDLGLILNTEKSMVYKSLNYLIKENLVMIEENENQIKYKAMNRLLIHEVYNLIPLTQQKQWHEKILNISKKLDEKLSSGELGRHCHYADKLEEAFQYYRIEINRLIKNYKFDAAIELLKKLLQLNLEFSAEDRILLEIQLAESLHYIGRVQERDAVIRRVFKQRSKTTSKKMIKVFELYSLSCLDTGQFEEGLKVLSEAREWLVKLDKEMSEAVILDSVYMELLRKKGNLSAAQDFMDRKLKEYNKQSNDSLELADFYNAAAELIITELLIQGNEMLSRAENLVLKAQRIYKKFGKKSGEIRCLNKLGMIFQDRNDFENARASYLQAAEISRQIGDRLSEAICLGNVPVDFSSESLDQSINKHIRLLDAAEEAGADVIVASAYNNIGANNAERSNIRIAVECLEKTISIFKKLGFSGRLARTYFSLAIAYEIVSNYEKALENYKRCVNLYRELQVLPHELYASIAVANILRLQYRFDESEKLLNDIQKRATSAGITSIASSCYVVQLLRFTTQGDVKRCREVYEQIKCLNSDQSESSQYKWHNMLLTIQQSYMENNLSECQQKLECFQKNDLCIGTKEKINEFSILIPVCAGLGNYKMVHRLIEEEYAYINKVHPNRIRSQGEYLYHCSLEKQLIGDLVKSSVFLNQSLDLANNTGNQYLQAVCYLGLIEHHLILKDECFEKHQEFFNKSERIIENIDLIPLRIRWLLLKGLNELVSSPSNPELALSYLQKALNSKLENANVGLKIQIYSLMAGCLQNSDNVTQKLDILSELETLLEFVSETIDSKSKRGFNRFWKLNFYLDQLAMETFQKDWTKYSILNGSDSNPGNDYNKEDRRVTKSKMKFENVHTELQEYLKKMISEENSLESNFEELIRIINADRIIFFSKTRKDTLKPLVINQNSNCVGGSCYSSSIPEQVLITGKTIMKSWVFGEESTIHLTNSMNNCGILAVIAMPIKVNNQVEGVMYLDSSSVFNSIHKKEMDLLEEIASIAWSRTSIAKI